MAPKLKLYGPVKGNKNVYKGLIAAQYVGVELETTPDFTWNKDNKTPEFLKLNPNGKIPTLETPSGGVWESNAVARYIARLSDAGLFGATTIDAAHVEQWIDFSTLSIDAPLSSWTYPILYPGMAPYDKKKEEAAIASVKNALTTLDKHLSSNTYLVGQHVTLADIIASMQVYNGYTTVFDEAFRAQFPAVNRWFLTLVNQPQFAKVIGPIELLKEAKKYTGKPKEAAKPKEANAGKPKDAIAGKPKEAAAPATPAQDSEDKPAPKPKNPLDLLPPSKMILDSWKRLYSNTPAAKFREICINGLWNGADIPNSPNNEHFEGFDPEGFSIFFLDYKYPEENTVNFIVMNKVGGFLQRIDYARKHAFGAICILKDDKGQFPIRGLFIFRGQDIPPMMKEECYDLDLYNWSKVDISDPAQKKRVEDILAEEATIDGLENVEVKVFK